VVEVDLDELLCLLLWTELVRYRANYRCQKCGAAGPYLAAHHIDEDKANCRLSNGECLCRRCHSKHHANSSGAKHLRPGWNKGKRGVSPETSQRMSEANHRRYERPGERERTSAAMKRSHAARASS
jgi:hypothetical protein